MIKSALFLTLTLIAANLLFAQNYRTIQFVDAVYNKPVYGVMVFINGDFVSVSDDNGNCRVNDTINEIYCKYLGFRDTLVNIESFKRRVIKLETNFNLLGEVEVDAKYDAKKHLLKLLNESQQTTYGLDTVIYYKFKEINTIQELGQTEIFTGILKVENTGHSGGGCIVFVSEIFNYYNSTEQEIYQLMQTKLMNINSIVMTLNSNVLYPIIIKRIKKKNSVERPNLSSGDSISFSVLTKKNNVDIEFSYINFVKDRIKTRAFAGTNNRSDEYCKYYFDMDYSLLSRSIPEHIVFSREYGLKNDLVFNNYIELEKIDNPNNESELNILFFNLNNKELVEKAKMKFPDIEIPAELIEN